MIRMKDLLHLQHHRKWIIITRIKLIKTQQFKIINPGGNYGRVNEGAS